MTTAPNTTALDAECTAFLQEALTGFIAFGNRLLKVAVEKAEAGTLPVEKATTVYDRVTRSGRRTVLLIRKLAEPVKTVNRVAARKRIIRAVEDEIQRHVEEPEAEALRQEFLERLDSPDCEEELADRPLEDIITDIIRDLGLVSVPGSHPWKYRSPADFAELCALAARPAAGAPPQTSARPQIQTRPDAPNST